MKQEYWIFIALIVLVLIFVFLGFGLGPKIATENPDKSIQDVTDTKISLPIATKPASAPAVKLATFTSIFPQKGSYQCDYEESSSSKVNSGVVYFSDGKMRIEFRTSRETANIMVYDGINMYNWVEGQTKGAISQPKSVSDFPAIIPKDFTTGKVLSVGDTNVSWLCHAWLKEASKLVRPSYLTF